MTIFEAYNTTKHELEAAGIEDYVFEAKQIIRHVTGYSNTEIMMRYAEQLPQYRENMLTAIIKQRLARYPLQYIFGEWSFYGRRFFVGPGVLVPRADTETVIDVCKEFLKSREKPEVLDLCSGSGCIGITVALEKPDSHVVTIEKFSEAMTYLKKNITLNAAQNVTPCEGDIFESAGAGGRYDLIVSNPPYIPADEMETVSPETEFEPENALYGGEDGLMFYRAIIENYRGCLCGGGMLCFEVGIHEADAVKLLLSEAGFSSVGGKDDLNGIERVVFGTVAQV